MDFSLENQGPCSQILPVSSILPGNGFAALNLHGFVLHTGLKQAGIDMSVEKYLILLATGA